MNVRPEGVEDPAVVEALGAYVKLLRASRSVVARIEPYLASRGLTSTQLGVLEALLHLGPLTQSELGRKVLTSAGNMTDVVDKLERRGLVQRTRKPGDRRAVQVELTDSGQEHIRTVFPRHAEDIARAMGGLGEAELRTLGRLLGKLGRHAAAPLAADADGIT